MDSYVKNGQVMKPIEPLLVNIDGKIDEEKHPFIVISQDEDSVYGFHMTSSKQPDSVIGNLLNIKLNADEHIEYYNKQIKQSSYVKVDHIHKVELKDLYYKCGMYGFVKPATKEILDCLITRHLFLSDYGLIPNDEYTDRVIKQNNMSPVDIRSTKFYRDSLSIFIDPAFDEVISSRISNIQQIEAIRNQLLYILSMIENGPDEVSEEVTEEHHMGRAA